MATLAERLSAHADEQARAIAGRYQAEIVDYAASDTEFIENDVVRVTRRGLGQVLDNIAANAASPPGPRPGLGNIRAHGAPPTPEQLKEFRELLGRRPHQGVALPAIQHAFRIFGEEVFEALAACASPDDPEELQAVIRGGAIIMRFAHEVISVVTQTYLDELEDVSGDREIVTRSLLDAVLAGRAESASSVRDARILGIELLAQNVVIVARAPMGDDDADDAEEQRPRTLRRAAKILHDNVLEYL